MPATGFKFVDLPDAAQRLGITRLQMLELVEAGRIRPFMGKGQQSVFRAADIDRLAKELTGDGPLEANADPITPVAADITRQEADSQEAQPPARAKRRDPIKLIGTRLSMDSRWAEITDEDIATWLDSIEAVQFDRVRRVIALTHERLNHILAAIDRDPRSSGI